MKSLWTLWLTILISTTTHASLNEDAIVLNPGEKAPIRGAFIPEYRFKEIAADAQNKWLFENRLHECEEEKDEAVENYYGQFKAFGVGVVAGGVLMWMASTLARK